MKKILLAIAIIFTCSLYAQNISGQAFYESKTTVDMDQWGRRGGQPMSEDRKKQISERMRSMLEKTYILTFNGNESIYKEEEKLEVNEGGGRMRMMMGSFTAGNQYKNLKGNELLEEREFFGKAFLIKDTVANLQWTVTKESKQIGQYLAIKATATKQLGDTDFSFMRRRRNRENETDTKEKAKQDSIANTDPMSQVEIPKELIVTAWFTPQIPVKNGPAEYGGLPGLILELNIDRTTLLCSKIVLNPAEAEKITPPKKGKEVTREEFNKIVKEKTDEMRENFRDRGGRRGNMRFGG